MMSKAASKRDTIKSRKIVKNNVCTKQQKATKKIENISGTFGMNEWTCNSRDEENVKLLVLSLTIKSYRL